MRSFLHLDEKYIWHPFTQMRDALPHIPVVSARDAVLITEDGRRIIDAISSWWVNLHGHCNREIQAAIQKQAAKLDHVIFAGFTHEPAAIFAEKLLNVLGNDQAKIFYSDNGSTSVEVALKMAVQYWHNKGLKKNRIVALANSYHGDTFGAMSVAERGSFNLPFQDMMFEVDFIDISADNAQERMRQIVQTPQNARHNDIAAFIFEPLVQGAGGMLMHEPALLDSLIGMAKTAGVITIADEVMTGFGRTGKWFASHYLTQSPDIFCLSKGITGGVLPLGATTCTMEIYNAFLSSDKKKTFFHGHSYTANPISLAAAIASFDVLNESFGKITQLENYHKQFLGKISGLKYIQNARMLGTILAFEVVIPDPQQNNENENPINENKVNESYFNEIRDTLYKRFLDAGVLLRPLGNVVYIMPPYCISRDELFQVYDAIIHVLNSMVLPE